MINQQMYTPVECTQNYIMIPLHDGEVANLLSNCGIEVIRVLKRPNAIEHIALGDQWH